MRASTNISLKERRSLTLDNFKGVDFSSPLSVRGDRASNMRNFICENGVNKKRNGWKELLKLEGNINGIFEYINGEHREIIVHAGIRFYRVNENYESEELEPPTKYGYDKFAIQDRRSQAFISKGRLYITGCGDYLVYGTWDEGKSYELRRVYDNEDTYIPTTTISIDNDSVEDDRRAYLDAANCLSSKRINTLVGVDRYQLTKDAHFVEGKQYYIRRTEITSYESPEICYYEVFTYVAGGEISENMYYEKKEGHYAWTLDTQIDEDTEVFVTIETPQQEYNNSEEGYVYSQTQTTEIKFSKGYTYVNEDVEDPDILVRAWFDADRQTMHIDGIDTTPPISNRDNITVTFTRKPEGYDERIKNCNFGTVFGVDGNLDRLFLSGNPDYPNMDFNSESDDFTYFSDQGYATYGNSSVAINGYSRLSDSTLAVFKEENNLEASVYYRSGKYQTTTEDGVEIIKAIFPVRAGNIGEGCVSRYACANFGGDNIILSSNGVFGITLLENVATTDRFSRERSQTVNERLRRHKDLSEAVGIVYKNKYYLAVDGVCYVADARYKYVPEDSVNGAFNYEWWFWDNIPARVWANIGGELCFGTADGRVCVFDGEYTDRTRLSNIRLATTEEPSEISFPEGIDLAVGDIVSFSGNSETSDEELYAYVAGTMGGGIPVSISGDKVQMNVPDDIVRFWNGMELIYDDFSAKKNCTVVNRDVDRGSFELEDAYGEKINIASEFRLLRCIFDHELYVAEVHMPEFTGDKNTFKVKEYLEDKNPLILTGSPDRLVATITHKENVVAEWITPILDLGTNESSKTLLKMTVSTAPDVSSKLLFGYETKNAGQMIEAKRAGSFSFDDFFFDNFSFEKEFASSYSVICNERNFNYIVFKFKSDSNENCVLSSFTAIYKINKSNKGVR